MKLRTLFRSTAIFLALAGAAGAWAGCSAGADGGGSTTGAGGSTGGSTGAGTGTGGESIITIDGGGDPDATTLEDGGVCTGTTAMAQLIPLDIIVVLDKSGSMIGTKWDGTTAALKAFVGDSESAGIGVGLVFFPNNKSDDCVYTDYAALDVPIGTLPGNATALTTAIDANDADGSDTPTFGALKGALYAATAYQDANPTHKVIALLATDGDPNGCSTEAIPDIAALAQAAHNYNGVQTYVIGCQGSTISNLDQIAAAGGTMTAYDVTQDITQFSAKMSEIRASALQCEFVIPPPPGTQQLDPGKVNVSYTPSTGGTGQKLPQAANKADCGNKAGWYYNSPTDPKKILLCPASCQKVQSDPGANISVEFGCKTMIN